MLSTIRPIVVTPDGGKRFTIQVRGHRVTVDQPIDEGGQDDGPTPVELLGSGLAACVALYVERFLNARGYPADGMRIEVMQHAAANPPRIGDFAVRVVLPMQLPSAYGELIERTVATCPAYNTFVNAARIGVTVEMAQIPAFV
jgi:putative redox protein